MDLKSIKVLRKPKVYVVGRQVFLTSNLSPFLEDMGAGDWVSSSQIPGELLAETAGRLCFLSYKNPRPGGNSAYLANIIKSGHGSVLEAATWNLIIENISRSCSHELVRHRVGMSPSQVSQRYVDESVAEYVEPQVIAEDPDLHKLWLEAIGASHRAYVELAERLVAKTVLDPQLKDLPATDRQKAARQAARSVLPNACETKIFVSLNARSARNLLEQRGSRHADPEIRLLANILLDVLQQESQSLFGDYVRTPLPDGTFEITTPYPKV